MSSQFFTVTACIRGADGDRQMKAVKTEDVEEERLPHVWGLLAHWVSQRPATYKRKKDERWYHIRRRGQRIGLSEREIVRLCTKIMREKEALAAAQ